MILLFEFFISFSIKIDVDTNISYTVGFNNTPNSFIHPLRDHLLPSSYLNVIKRIYCLNFVNF